MELLRNICNSYGKWKPLEDYILRIETYRDNDGVLVLENCKALIESICKTILEDLDETIPSGENIQNLVSTACNKMTCLPNTSDLTRSFVTVAQRLGEFRNDFSVIGHGASVYQIEDRRNKITRAATDFMITTVEQLAVFLITVYQEEYPTAIQKNIRYEDNTDFNQQLDEDIGPIQIGIYGPYSPSEILFNIEIDAYRTAITKDTIGEQ
jgi:hypothetical protein